MCALVDAGIKRGTVWKPDQRGKGTQALAGIIDVCVCCVQPPVHAVASRVMVRLRPVFDVTPTCVGRFMVAVENPMGCARDCRSIVM